MENVPEQPNSHDEIKKLIEKNIQLSEEILELSKKTKKYLFIQQMFSVFKWLIIIVPLVLGILYLPPLLQNLISQYKEIFGGVANPSVNFNSIPSELLESFKR